MADRHVLLDHTYLIERRRRHRWTAIVWRNEFDRNGIIVGSVKVGEITSWSRTAVRHRARSLIRQARKRGTPWSHPIVTRR